MSEVREAARRGAAGAPRRADTRLARRGGGVELLRLPAALFGAAVRLRGALYDRGVLPVMRVETPVVSVGNLAAGGTGKTPMTVWVVRALRERGLRPGILSRGYRGGAGGNDEALMLARSLPDVPHVQGPDRVAGAHALEERGVDAIVLDDGFQHRRLARDLDVVLVDATRPWGLGSPPGGGEPVCALLPRGLLRERPTALARAHAIVVTRSDALPAERLARLRDRLEGLAPGAPVALARHAPAGLLALRDGALVPLAFDELAGRDVDLVSGIGNPEAFEATVRALGASVQEHRAFPDHHRFTPRDLDGLGARPVLTTAKDAVKLADVELDLWILDVALEIVEGEAVLHALLDALPEATRRRERRAFHEGLHG